MKLVRWVACVSALGALLLMTNSHISAAPRRDDIADLDAFISKALKEYQVPGTAIAVVRDGKVVLAKRYSVFTRVQKKEE